MANGVNQNPVVAGQETTVVAEQPIVQPPMTQLSPVSGSPMMTPAVPPAPEVVPGIVDAAASPAAPMTPDPVLQAQEEERKRREEEERQRQQAEAAEQQRRFNEKKKELEAPSALTDFQKREVTDAEVYRALDQEDEVRDEEAREADKAAKRAEEQEQEALQRQVNERRFELESAERRGTEPPPPDPELDALIAQQAEEEIATSPATEEDVVQAQQPTVEEVEQAAEPVRQAAAVQQAQAEQQSEQLENIRATRKKLDEEEAATAKRFTSMADIFESGSTGQRIGTVLSVLAGGLAQGMVGGPNQAVAALDKVFQDNVRKLNLDIKEQDKRRKQYYDLIDQELRIRAANTKDEVERTRLEQMRQAMAIQRNQTRAADEFNELLKAGKLRKEDIGMLPPKERDRVVIMPDGSAELAKNKKAAEDFDKTITETRSGIDQLRKLRRMFYDPEFSLFSPTDRTASEAQRQQLVGALRLSLVGPGALTEKEIGIIQGVIGDPTKFTFRTAERRKINNLIQTAIERVKIQADSAGISRNKIFPLAERRTAAIEKMKKAGLSKERAEDLVDRRIALGQLRGRPSR